MIQIQMTWTKDKQIQTVDNIQGESLVEVLSKLLLHVVTLQEKIIEDTYRDKAGYNDIPF